jgi:hypothetical protein
MRSDHKPQEIFEQIARPKVRSTLFWWLLENHDEITKQAAKSGVGLRWTELCSQFTKLGLTDQAGNPITRQTAIKTWWRVRKEKARLDSLVAAAKAESAARAAGRDQRKIPPAHFKKSWQPDDVTNPRPEKITLVAPPGARWWNDTYWFDAEGYISLIDNRAISAMQRQRTNASVGRDKDYGLADILGPPKEKVR